MTLDLPTLVVMQKLCARVRRRHADLRMGAKPRGVGVGDLGFANLLAAAGVLSLMFGATLRVPLYMAAGGVLCCARSRH